MRHVQTKSQEAKGKKSQIGTLLRQHLPQSLLKLSQRTFIHSLSVKGRKGRAPLSFAQMEIQRPRVDEAPLRKMQSIQCIQSALFGIDDNLQGERTCAPLFFFFLPSFLLILSFLFRETI